MSNTISNSGTRQISGKAGLIYDSRQVVLSNQDIIPQAQHLEQTGSLMKVRKDSVIININLNEGTSNFQAHFSGSTFGTSLREVSVPFAEEGSRMVCVIFLFLIADHFSYPWLAIPVLMNCGLGYIVQRKELNMSLVISTTTHQGAIIASDSRQSFRNRKGHARIGSDSVSKLFQLSKRVGVGLTGIAFLPEDGVPRNIGYFIDQFKQKYKTDLKKWKTEEIAKNLLGFLHEKYDYKSAQEDRKRKIEGDLTQKKFQDVVFKPWRGSVLEFSFKDSKSKAGKGVSIIDAIKFIVVGYDRNKKQKVFIGSIPGVLKKKRDGAVKGKEYGADWIGQTDVVSRIVLGWDPRIEKLPFVQSTIQRGGVNTVGEQLRGLEYVIQWGTMALQDAIDFCDLAIRTTEALQRFSDGVVMDPGDMPGVGGEVDVALITPNKGFEWLRQKEIRYSQS